VQVRFNPPRHLTDLRLFHSQARQKTARGFGGDFARLLHPITKRALGHASVLREATNGPAVLNEKTQVTVNRNGAHAPYVLPTIGNVKRGRS